MIDGLKKPQQKTKPSLVGAWRSLVAHLVWDQGVASSNLAAPTKFFKDGAGQKLASRF